MDKRPLKYYLVKNILSLLDEKVTLHGIRVAYIMLKMYEYENRPKDNELLQLIEVCIYHDIGAYKIDEVNDLFCFENESTYQHTAYGYLFIKHLSALDEYAEIILHHHLKYEAKPEYSFRFIDESIRVHLADRVDIANFVFESEEDVINNIKNLANTSFDPGDVELFIKANEKYRIIDHLRANDYERDIVDFYSHYPYNFDGMIQILKMLVLSINFISEQTVIHTVSSAVMSRSIGRYFNLNENELGDIFVGALLHDIGKISVPAYILEGPHYLNEDEIEIMRKHVHNTYNLISDYISEDIVNIAVRHHERSDGSGYPSGLKDCDLTLSEKIVAVADVVCALNEKKYYKENMSKSEILKIIHSMAERNEFDSKIIKVINDNYDEIMSEVLEASREVIRQYENLRNDYIRLVQQRRRKQWGINLGEKNI